MRSHSKGRYLVHIPKHPEAGGYVTNLAAATRILSYYFVISGTGTVYDTCARRSDPWRYIMKKYGELSCVEPRPLQMTEKLIKEHYGEKYWREETFTSGISGLDY